MGADPGKVAIPENFFPKLSPSLSPDDPSPWKTAGYATDDEAPLSALPGGEKTIVGICILKFTIVLTST
jgi:hypothetical protein